ncbi:MAG: OsmC family protein [Bdellovibrionaceae bacterium]|jgi:organic hydroperoxide reductase OsmC/OhrA|nr:OsmC family protein [Pseudobdellovibrionaceae bacterium]MBX3033829.1 OsmC family protein [Pseudobdellovibrionaceae bacterium]
MPFPFPHEYKVELDQAEGSLATLKGESEPSLRGGPPPHFDGPGGVWSPETLLLGAVELCYFTTLRSLTRRQGVEFTSYRSTIRGYLDKSTAGIVFTGIELDVSLNTSTADMEKLRTLLQSAKKYCIISNALKTEVQLKIDLSAND